jgi:glycosyltransferase involved in cell wall biosynthesis
MKVLALLHQYVPVRNAGAETMLHGMLSALARAGYEVHASLSMQVGEPYVQDAVQVWPRTEGQKANHIPHLHGTSLLIAHLDNSEPAAFLGHLNDIPVILVHHNTFDVSRKMLHFYGARVDLVVTNSQWMTDNLNAWHAINELTAPPILIMRPLERWPVGPIEGPHDRVTLVNMKRLKENTDGGWLTKGGETFWRIAERMPNTPFLGVKGAYGDQAPGQLPNVEVIGHVPATQIRERVYARARVVIMPSNYESWGRVASEAMACGVPVIAAPTPGLAENLGDAGKLVDWQDVDGYVRALQTLALPGPYAAACRKALARAGQQQRLYDVEEAAWLEAVQRVARNSPRSSPKTPVLV